MKIEEDRNLHKQIAVTKNDVEIGLNLTIKQTKIYLSPTKVKP